MIAELDGASSEALPGILALALVLVLVAVLAWMAVGRPVLRYLRRSPCPSCGLTFDGRGDRCPHCGASRTEPAHRTST
jgi:hypothetical protein